MTEPLIFKKDNYSIKYPKGWKVDTSGLNMTELIIQSPKESPADRFNENLNLLIQHYQNLGITLEKYMAASVKQINGMHPTEKLRDSIISTGPLPKHGKLIYGWTQQGLKLKFIQYAYIIEEKAYLLTFTTELDKFDRYKSIGEQILRSFVVK